jgi:hypothetical protein
VIFIFIDMLLFKRNHIEKIILHLENYISLNEWKYVIEYENDITKDIVYTEPTEMSNHLDRYNEFSINVTNYFEDYPSGFWTYRVYQYRADPLVKHLLQVGKMKLVGEAFDFTEYDGQDDEFIVYTN